MPMNGYSFAERNGKGHRATSSEEQLVAHCIPRRPAENPDLLIRTSGYMRR